MLVTVDAPSGAGDTASPNGWVGSFCTIVTAMRGDLGLDTGIIPLAADPELAAPIPTGASDVEVTLAIAAKNERIATLLTRTADRIRALPVPNVDGGAKIKRIVSRTLGGALDKLASTFAKNADKLQSAAAAPTDEVSLKDQIALMARRSNRKVNKLSIQIQAAFEAIDSESNVDSDGRLARALLNSPYCLSLLAE